MASPPGRASSPAGSPARSARTASRRSLPPAVRGSASRRTNRAGTLNPARRPRTWAVSATSPGSSAPSSRTTRPPGCAPCPCQGCRRRRPLRWRGARRAPPRPRPGSRSRRRGRCGRPGDRRRSGDPAGRGGPGRRCGTARRRARGRRPRPGTRRSATVASRTISPPRLVLVGEGEVDAGKRHARGPGWSQASSEASAVAPDATSDRPYVGMTGHPARRARVTRSGGMGPPPSSTARRASGGGAPRASSSAEPAAP